MLQEFNNLLFFFLIINGNILVLYDSFSFSYCPLVCRLSFVSNWVRNKRQETQEMGNPHALVIPFPGQGHVIPFMEFSHCLAAAGFKITFVNTNSFMNV